MKWSEVVKIHKQISATYIVNCELQSLLFSPDKRKLRIFFQKGNDLFFCFQPKTRSHIIESLKNAYKSHKLIPVFKKISPDHWENIGLHKIIRHYEGEDANGRHSIIFVASPNNIHPTL